MNEIEQLKQFGISFNGYSKFIGDDMAMDAALQTQSNAGVPVAFTTYIDPVIVNILTSPLNATEISTERRMGDWTTSYAQFLSVEETGFVQPYDDYANNGVSDVNANFPVRQNFVYETTITYGDRESEIAGKGRINLISRKQQSAANTLKRAQNTFYLRGVQGLANYGIMNDPDLPTALTPANVGTQSDPVTEWEDKDANQIYNDILAMMTDMVTRSKGLVNMKTRVKMVVSPATNAQLMKTNGLMTTSVLAFVKANLPNIDVVVIPEFETQAGNLIQLWADTVTDGEEENKVMELAYSEKMRAGRVVPGLSHFKQKFTAGTFGAVIYQPYAVSQMLGV